jgi:hypothetical protein
MPLEQTDKRILGLYGDKMDKGPSTNISIHSVVIYQFDRTARGGFSFVSDIQNTSAPTCCGIGDTALIRQTGYQLFAFPREVRNQRLSTVEVHTIFVTEQKEQIKPYHPSLIFAGSSIGSIYCYTI